MTRPGSLVFPSRGVAKADTNLKSLKHKAWRFGLTLDELHEVMTRYDGACPIHGGSPTDMVIDHCHETGRVRDYICRTCNTEVGWYERGRTDMRRPFRPEVIAYVERWAAP